MKSEELLKKELPYEIMKRLKINFDGRQFFVRIPAEIKEYLKVKKGDEFEFFIDPKDDKEGYHKFKIIRGKKQ